MKLIHSKNNNFRNNNLSDKLISEHTTIITSLIDKPISIISLALFKDIIRNSYGFDNELYWMEFALDSLDRNVESWLFFCINCSKVNIFDLLILHNFLPVKDYNHNHLLFLKILTSRSCNICGDDQRISKPITAYIVIENSILLKSLKDNKLLGENVNYHSLKRGGFYHFPGRFNQTSHPD